MSGSLSFDRVADIYDRTRETQGDKLSAAIELLNGTLPTDPLIEIGVGTGALAIPLARAGRRVVGVDVSTSMLDRLVQKDRPDDLGLAVADATALPFGGRTFAGAYCRWVLHLIPEWRAAVAELARVCRPRGTVVIEPGGYGSAGWRELYLKFVDILGEDAAPVGLDLRNEGRDLDAAFAALGATFRGEVRSAGVFDGSLARFLSEAAQRTYSWTWRVPEDELLRAIDEVREWAPRHFGVGLDEPFGPESPHRWRIYDLH